MRLAVTATCVLAVAAACREEPPEAGLLTLTQVDTLIPAASAVFERPSELTGDEYGHLYIADAGRSAIIVLDSSGTPIRQIGQAGSGPGELQSPRSVSVSNDTVRVLDAGNGRIAVFTARGTHVRVQTAPPGAVSGPVAFYPSGEGVVGRNGEDSALVQRFDAQARPGARLGRPVVPSPSTWDFTSIKKQIWDGQVPAEIRNLVLPVPVDDGSLWLLLQAEGYALRYSPGDSLQLRLDFPEPEFAEIRADFFARNRGDSAANRFYHLAYFTSAREIGTELWCLLRQPSTVTLTTLLVVSRDGKVLRRLRIPGTTGVRGFALSPDRRTLYLLAYEDAAILRVRIPSAQ